MSPAEDQKKKPVGFRFDPELENHLQLVSDRSGIKKTVLVEQALGYYFGDHSDPVQERRRNFVLSVVGDLVQEGLMPGDYAPTGRSGGSRPAHQARVKPDATTADAASSASAKPVGKAHGEASKHARRTIAARLKRRSGPQ